MPPVVYTSNVTIRRLGGPLRAATLPAEPAPVYFGVHGAIANHYGADMSKLEPHATTLDYVVAAAGGWLTGTFAGALAAREITLEPGDVVGDVTGEIETEGGVLVIRRIHVTFRLRGIPDEQRETVERVRQVYAHGCPVARTIGQCVAIDTAVVFPQE